MLAIELKSQFRSISHKRYLATHYDYPNNIDIMSSTSYLDPENKITSKVIILVLIPCHMIILGYRPRYVCVILATVILCT